MAQKNRLKLDFGLSTATERQAFLENYLKEIDFAPNEYELESMGSYLLWGVDKDGKNAQQRGDCVLKDWDATAASRHETSLEGLLEDPVFNENSLRPASEPPTKLPRIKLDRERIRQTAPATYLDIFEELWHRIDYTDLITELYELNIGKRTKPIRPELLQAIPKEEFEAAAEYASQLTQYHYLKLKHQLVDLRREQYTYKDMYAPLHERHGEASYSKSITLSIDDALPLGLYNQAPSSINSQIWTWPIQPSLKEEFQKEQLSNFLWEERSSNLVFDFREVEHLYAAFNLLEELKDTDFEKDPESQVNAFIQTLEFYAAAADLNDIQREIFDAKLQRKTNNQIRETINSKYGTTYNENYISTIWKKKILEMIAEVAKIQELELKEVFFEENWKKCSRCGRLLLRDPRYFMRKKTSSDGLGARCKKCEKEIRQSKEKKNG